MATLLLLLLLLLLCHLNIEYEAIKKAKYILCVRLPLALSDSKQITLQGFMST
jgi:hypothetical protein